MANEHTTIAGSLVSAVVVRAGRIALLARGPERWLSSPGYTLVPVELPGGSAHHLEPPSRAAARIAALELGVPIRTLASRSIYGPSRGNHLDRLSPGSEAEPWPLLRHERAVLVGAADGSDERLATVEVRAYLAASAGEPTLGNLSAGLVWASPRGMLTLLRGVVASDLISMSRHVAWWPNLALPLPDDAYLYVPADLGERFVTRIVAKYGRGVLEGVEVSNEHGL